jgi:hypothetical protein
VCAGREGGDGDGVAGDVLDEDGLPAVDDEVRA